MDIYQDRVLIEKAISLKELSDEEFQRLTNNENDFSSIEDVLQEFLFNEKEEVRKKAEIIKRKFLSAKRTFGIYEHDCYVGYVSFTNYESSTPEIQIELKEGYRNKGIGYLVLSYLTEKLFLERGDITYFLYCVRADNAASIKLIEKLGGKIVKAENLIAKIISKYYLFRK